MLRWILFIVLYLLLGFYTLQALKTASRYPWVHWTFISLSLLVLFNFIFQFTLGSETGRVLSRPKSYAFGFLLAFISFNLVIIPILLGEDIIRVILGVPIHL